jgi:hypothetical protein
MSALFTVIAAIVVKYLVDVVKIVGDWISQIAPSLPSWVRNLLPLWKLLAAIAVTILVVWSAGKFEVELEHPLAVLVLAQITHEITDAVKKTKREAS